jgi:hypothetical protein
MAGSGGHQPLLEGEMFPHVFRKNRRERALFEICHPPFRLEQIQVFDVGRSPAGLGDPAAADDNP